jgi:hypothetical protein
MYLKIFQYVLAGLRGMSALLASSRVNTHAHWNKVTKKHAMFSETV